eukprot:6213568-Pleurochrysis_carterae.AAC.4
MHNSETVTACGVKPAQATVMVSMPCACAWPSGRCRYAALCETVCTSLEAGSLAALPQHDMKLHSPV